MASPVPQARHPTASLQVAVLGVGLLGPGLPGWRVGAHTLTSPEPALSPPTEVPPPTRLPATERRRAGPLVKASVVVAEEACQHAGLDPSALATVFTSSTGEPQNCHLLCEALAAPERTVSPTRFTNSVHNAAAGYWHIAVQGRHASTSLAAYDASFAAGLLEAAVQCHSSGQAVLLVACDVPYPQPLHALRPVTDTFAVALVLGPCNAQASDPSTPAQLSLHPASGLAATVCAEPALEALRQAIPAARCLPLLQALAAHAHTPSAAFLEHMVLEGLTGQNLGLSLR